MDKHKKTTRKAPRMTFELKKIQAIELFLKEKIAFHKAARIKASVLYTQYEDFLTRCGILDCKVEKYNLWALIKQVLEPDLANTLEKTHSKELYYVGLDLKENSISTDQILRLYELGISPFAGHLISVEGESLINQLYDQDVDNKDQVVHTERVVKEGSKTEKELKATSKKRGRPKKESV